MTSSEQLDQQQALAALRKRQAGQTPTTKELQALRRWEKSKDETQRSEHYRTIPQKHYREMSGRPTKVLHEQEALYGIPCGGKTVDLAKLLRWLHDFLAKHGPTINRAADAAADPAAAVRDRQRLAQAQRAEFALQRDMGQWVRRDEVREGLAVFANLLRRSVEVLQRKYGPEARDIIAQAMAAATRVFQRTFSSVDSDGNGGDGNDNDFFDLAPGDPHDGSNAHVLQPDPAADLDGPGRVVAGPGPDPPAAAPLDAAVRPGGDHPPDWSI